jgi:hypothetical protein
MMEMDGKIAIGRKKIDCKKGWSLENTEVQMLELTHVDGRTELG